MLTGWANGNGNVTTPRAVATPPPCKNSATATDPAPHPSHAAGYSRVPQRDRDARRELLREI